MKLIIPCNQCGFSESEDFKLTFVNAEITHDGVYELLCEKGHHSVTFLQEQQFEILFDMGVMALLDGYTREAVASFSASLERFYEFSVKLILAKNQIVINEVEKTWKLVSRQSERQIGAFYFIYLNEFESTPPSVEGKRVEFRNNVIHKGYFPKYQETLEYGEYVYYYILNILKALRKSCWDGYSRLATQNQIDYFNKNPEKAGKVSVMTIPTMFHLTVIDELFGKNTFEEALEDLKTRRLRAFAQ